MAFVNSESLTLTYRESGSTNPLLLLAGGPGMSADYMLPVLERLADSHRVILPDQRGTRTSARPEVTPENYTIGKFVADLESLREHLGLQEWAVLGHSWGGTLGMAHACAHPSQVSKLGLVGTCGPTLDFLPPALEGLGSRMTPEDVVPPGESSADPDVLASHNARASLPAFFKNRALGEQYRETQQGVISTAGVFGKVMQSLAAEGFDLRPTLRDLHMPALVIHGDYDHIPVRYAQEVAECLPNSIFEVLPECGHFPWIEAEARFYMTVTEFLS